MSTILWLIIYRCQLTFALMLTACASAATQAFGRLTMLNMTSLGDLKISAFMPSVAASPAVTPCK